MTWLPIDSAPKGPWIIGTNGKRVAPMAWEKKCGDDDYTGWCGAASVTGGLLYCDPVDLGFDPTHWWSFDGEPMPPPPEQP